MQEELSAEVSFSASEENANEYMMRLFINEQVGIFNIGIIPYIKNKDANYILVNENNYWFTESIEVSDSDSDSDSESESESEEGEESSSSEEESSEEENNEESEETVRRIGIEMAFTVEEIEGMDCLERTSESENDEFIAYSCEVVYKFLATEDFSELLLLDASMTLQISTQTKALLQINSTFLLHLQDVVVDYTIPSQALICLDANCLQSTTELVEFVYGDDLLIKQELVNEYDKQNYYLELLAINIIWDSFKKIDLTSISEVTCANDCLGSVQVGTQMVIVGQDITVQIVSKIIFPSQEDEGEESESSETETDTDTDTESESDEIDPNSRRRRLEDKPEVLLSSFLVNVNYAGNSETSLWTIILSCSGALLLLAVIIIIWCCGKKCKKCCRNEEKQTRSSRNYEITTSGTPYGSPERKVRTSRVQSTPSKFSPYTP